MAPTKQTDAAPSNYRKPPVEHQFKRGTSGNPNGRPRKNKAGQPDFGALGGGTADRFGEMALDEGVRPVTIREGEKISEIPAMQALYRTMFRAAAQGDTKAGRQLLDVILRFESRRSESAIELLQLAAQYKETYGPIFERHRREGREPPDIYPHPDDIIIDEISGEVTIDGPCTKEKAGARKAARANAIGAMARFFKVEAALGRDPTNKALMREYKELKKYHDYLEEDADRMIRHEDLKESRAALEPKSPSQKRRGRNKRDE